MKKYGMADVMLAAVRIYLATHLQHLEAAQREEIEKKCCAEILMKYPTVRDMEVGK